MSYKNGNLVKAEKEYAALRKWYVNRYDEIVEKLDSEGKLPHDLNWSSRNFQELSDLDKEVKRRFRALKEKYSVTGAAH